MKESKNEKQIASFLSYCTKHPQERFWQALRNWAGVNFIFAGDLQDGEHIKGSMEVIAELESFGLKDTFYWEGEIVEGVSNRGCAVRNCRSTSNQHWEKFHFPKVEERHDCNFQHSGPCPTPSHLPVAPKSNCCFHCFFGLNCNNPGCPCHKREEKDCEHYGVCLCRYGGPPKEEKVTADWVTCPKGCDHFLNEECECECHWPKQKIEELSAICYSNDHHECNGKYCNCACHRMELLAGLMAMRKWIDDLVRRENERGV